MLVITIRIPALPMPQAGFAGMTVNRCNGSSHSVDRCAGYSN